MTKKITLLQDEAAALVTKTSTTLSLQSKTTHILARLHAVNNAGTLPTLDVVVQHSPDGSTWTTILTFTQVTTSTDSNEDKQFKITDGLLFPYVRAVATIAGTNPSYDFTTTIYEGA